MQDHQPTSYAYLRVSTDRQDVDNQRHGVIQYAKKRGLEPLTFFEDTVSGKKEWRDREIGKLLEMAKEGDVIIVSEFSRLARSTRQMLELTEIAVKRGISIHVVKNNTVMDGSLNSKAAATFFGFFSEVERDFISQRTSESLQKRKAAGLPIGRQKGSTNESKKLDKHKDKIKEWLELGVTKQKIMEKVDCCERTLYKWMYKNGLERYIKTREGDEKHTHTHTAVPVVHTRARRSGSTKATRTARA